MGWGTGQGHPSLAGVLPWFSGREFKSYLPELGNASPVLIYNRDRDEGYVTIDTDGQPEIHYWPSAFDRKNMMRVRMRTTQFKPHVRARVCVWGCMTEVPPNQNVGKESRREGGWMDYIHCSTPKPVRKLSLQGQARTICCCSSLQVLGLELSGV